MVEPVSAGRAARGGVEQGAGHHGVTVQKGEPVDGADEFGIGISPSHPLGNGQTVEGLPCDLRQQNRRGLAAFVAAEHEPLALVRLDPVQLFDRGAAGACKTLRRPGGFAVRVESGLEGRSAALDFAVGLLQCQIPDPERQPARCSVGANRAVGESGVLETGNEFVTQRVPQTSQRRRRQFLRTQLEQEICVFSHWPPPSPGRAWESPGLPAIRSRPGLRRGQGCGRAG